jgi:protein TonB
VVPFWKVEVKPQPINIPVPTYPDMARTAGIEGQAVVEALVDVDGSVADARILKPSGNASLDQAAVDAAMRAKFTPAKQRDKAVRVWVSIPFRFTLTG